MAVSGQLKNQHLVWRAGFGPMAEDVAKLRHASTQTVYQAILKGIASPPQYINVADNQLQAMMSGASGDQTRQKFANLSAEEKKQLQKQSRQDLRNLNIAWFNEMVNSDAQLREKMSLFWHGHFASRNENIFYQQLLLDTIRRNALGNFGDLLHEVSKSAAMINFLNNNQNKKDHPNENFAREVMELFTLGRGNYTEQDVKEAARAFTGWGADIQGQFVFRKPQHDDGVKTVLGKTGNLNGDDVLDILLEHKQTARFISTKLYRYFVNDQVDPDKVEKMTDRFYHSQYDILDLMKFIFSSSWFYSESNIGSRIKSPIELMAGIRRMLPMDLNNEDAQIMVQRILGQVLFYPPNVAGWPGGMNWIDSSTLLFRMRLPQMIYASAEIQVRPKDDDDQMMGMKDTDDEQPKSLGPMKAKGGRPMAAAIDWQPYLRLFDELAADQLVSALSDLLLQTPIQVDQQVLGKYVDTASRETMIKSATIDLMSTPEYQLC